MMNLPTYDDLMAKLQAADPVRRAQAAYLLGELGDRRAVAALIAALDDTEDDVLSCVLKALGAIGDPQAVLQLVDLLVHPSKGYAVSYLRYALAVMSEAAFDPVVALTRHEEPLVREGAYYALGELKQSAVDAVLLAGLDDPDDKVADAAGVAIYRRRSAACIAPMVERLRQGTPSMQHRIASHLMWDDDPRMVEPLLECLNSPDTTLAKRAAYSLSRSSDVQVGLTLLAYVQRLPADQRPLWVVEDLGQHYHPRIIAQLVEWTRDPSWAMRYHAVLAFHHSEFEDSSIHDAILYALHDENPQVREAAAGASGNHPDPRAIDALLELLHDPFVLLPSQAAYALSNWLDEPRVFEAMESAATTNADVRPWFASGLEHSARADAVPRLLAMVNEVSGFYTVGVFRALAARKAQEAVPALIACLQDVDCHWAHAAALDALGSIQDTSAVPAIIPFLLNHRPKIGQQAYRVLRNIGGSLAEAALAEWDEWRGRC